MSELEAMDQFDRLLAAGFLLPKDADQAAVFREWAVSFRSTPVEDVAAGITKLSATRTDRWWPTVGELRGCIASIQESRGPSRHGCERCGGSKWVTATPYRANGGLVYEGVRRCPVCACPAPVLSGEGQQTPLDGASLDAWRAAQRPKVPVTSKAEYVARMAELRRGLSGRTMPAADLEEAS